MHAALSLNQLRLIVKYHLDGSRKSGAVENLNVSCDV
jgi:hypothetical protein